jgi:rod shape determining protein RodA
VTTTQRLRARAGGDSHRAAPAAGPVPGRLARLLGELDVLLLGSTAMVAALGVLIVYSATRAKLVLAGVNPHYYLDRQALFAVLGVGAMALFTVVDYHRLQELAGVAYGGLVLALLAVLSPLGSRALGSQRWFSLAGFQVQPSAFASLTLVVFVAAYVATTEGELESRRVATLLGLAALPTLLVVEQPDLGTGITMVVVLVSMLVVAGVRARYLVVLALLAVAGTLVVIHLGMLKRYQLDRLTAFVHQNGSPATHPAVYNLAESKIAIGSGGLLGKGLFHAPQTNLAYVPEQQTDFVFTAVGEQLGFVGAATLLGLFGVIVWRLWQAARGAKDVLGRLLCAGVLGLVGFSVFENVGMTMGIMPITGIPLPFVSYGGSAMVAACAAVGVAANVARHERAR